MRAILGSVCLGVLVLGGVVACGAEDANQVAPGATEATATQAPALPDGIPLPAGGSVVSGPESSKQADVRGWSAVALAAPDVDVSTISASLTRELEDQGWTEQVSPTEDDGTTISATRTDGTTSYWLDVNVTPPIPGGGSAVTYRFATGDAPFGKGDKLR
ncbi:MAG: hypothetical protein HQ526_02500 [Actinobacteria bacterium]|nr:hypothetical protein [Actinomycetota bacterium]